MVDTTPARPQLLDKLSPELRNRIYEYALLDTRVIQVQAEEQPSLTRTCRQVREESVQMYYHINDFGLITTSRERFALIPLLSWLERIGVVHCKVLRSISVRIGVTNGLLIKDTMREDDPWVVMMRRMQSLGISRSVAFDVVPCDEKPSPDFIELMTSGPTGMRDGYPRLVKQSVIMHMRQYLKTLSMQHLGRQPDFTHKYAVSQGWEPDLAMFQRCMIVSSDWLIHADRPSLSMRADIAEANEQYRRFLDEVSESMANVMG